MQMNMTGWFDCGSVLDTDSEPCQITDAVSIVQTRLKVNINVMQMYFR